MAAPNIVLEPNTRATKFVEARRGVDLRLFEPSPPPLPTTFRRWLLASADGNHRTARRYRLDLRREGYHATLRRPLDPRLVPSATCGFAEIVAAAAGHDHVRAARAAATLRRMGVDVIVLSPEWVAIGGER